MKVVSTFHEDVRSDGTEALWNSHGISIGVAFRFLGGNV